MKLSDAIRLGAMALPEVHGPTFKRDRNGRICGACAIGAALYAVGLTHTTEWDGKEAAAALPLLQHEAQHPLFGFTTKVYRIVIGLFEGCNWTREQIADWVESIEQSQDGSEILPPQTTDPVPVTA